MRLSFIHLAEDAYLDEARRLCILGIFDSMTLTSAVRPIPVPEFVLVVGFEGELGEPLDRDVAVQLFDDDEVLLEDVARRDLALVPSPHGHPPRALAAFRFERDRTFVPDYGDFHLRVSDGGRAIGSVRLSIVQAMPEGGFGTE